MRQRSCGLNSLTKHDKFRICEKGIRKENFKFSVIFINFVHNYKIKYSMCTVVHTYTIMLQILYIYIKIDINILRLEYSYIRDRRASVIITYLLFKF